MVAPLADRQRGGRRNRPEPRTRWLDELLVAERCGLRSVARGKSRAPINAWHGRRAACARSGGARFAFVPIRSLRPRPLGATGVRLRRPPSIGRQNGHEPAGVHRPTRTSIGAAPGPRSRRRPMPACSVPVPDAGVRRHQAADYSSRRRCIPQGGAAKSSAASPICWNLHPPGLSRGTTRYNRMWRPLRSGDRFTAIPDRRNRAKAMELRPRPKLIFPRSQPTPPKPWPASSASSGKQKISREHQRPWVFWHTPTVAVPSRLLFCVNAARNGPDKSLCRHRPGDPPGSARPPSPAIPSRHYYSLPKFHRRHTMHPTYLPRKIWAGSQ